MALLIQLNNSTFNFNGTEVKVHGTVEDPFFVGIEIGKILGYSRPHKAVNDHVDDENKKIETLQNVWGPKLGPQTKPHTRPEQLYVLINEAGLYQLIFSSKLYVAKLFTKWVCNVLKSIRLDGFYSLNQNIIQKDTELQIKTVELQIKESELQLIKLQREETNTKNSERVDLTNLNNNIPVQPEFTTVGREADILYFGKYHKGFKQYLGKIVPLFCEPFGKDCVDTFETYNTKKKITIQVNKYSIECRRKIRYICNEIFPYFDKSKPKEKIKNVLELLNGLI